MNPIYRNAKWHKENLIDVAKFIKRNATHYSKQLVKQQENDSYRCSGNTSYFYFNDEEFEYTFTVRRKKRLEEE